MLKIMTVKVRKCQTFSVLRFFFCFLCNVLHVQSIPTVYQLYDRDTFVAALKVNYGPSNAYTTDKDHARIKIYAEVLYRALDIN